MIRITSVFWAPVFIFAAAFTNVVHSKAPLDKATFKLVAEDNMPQCLAKCSADFSTCTNGGKTNIPSCTKDRKTCMDRCK